MGADDVSLVSTTEGEAEIRAALGLPATDPAPVVAPVVEGAPAEPAESVAPADGSKPPKPRSQSRIATLTRERYEMQARAEEAERRLAALEGRAPAEPAAPVAEPAAPAKPDPFADLGPEPKEDDFDGDFAKYQAAVRKYDRAYAKIEARVEAEAAARETIQQERRAAWEAQQREIQNQQALAYNQRLDLAKAQLPDFSDVMKQGETLPLIPAIAQWCQAEQNGIAIGYYLIKHPDVFDRIARLPAPMAWTALGRLDADYERGHLDLPKIAWDRPARTAAPATAPPAAPESAPVQPAAVPAAPVAAPVVPPAGRPSVQGTSRAPAPPPRVNGGGGAMPFDPETATQEEYKRWRAQGGGTH